MLYGSCSNCSRYVCAFAISSICFLFLLFTWWMDRSQEQFPRWAPSLHYSWTPSLPNSILLFDTWFTNADAMWISLQIRFSPYSVFCVEFWHWLSRAIKGYVQIWSFFIPLLLSSSLWTTLLCFSVLYRVIWDLVLFVPFMDNQLRLISDWYSIVDVIWSSLYMLFSCFFLSLMLY